MALQVACEAFIQPEDVECDCADIDEDVIIAYIDQASDILSILTNGKVSGICDDVVRPRQKNASVCGCSSALSCSCSELSGITLMGPNPNVALVLMDGIPFDDWIVVDQGLLLRTDGRAWPGCQDITKASSEPGTLEITYDYGNPVPQLAKDACAEIVCSFLKSPPQSQRALHPQARGVSIAGVQISLEQVTEELKRRTFLLPYTIRLLTVYDPNPGVVVYSPELEQGWTLHRRYEQGS